MDQQRGSGGGVQLRLFVALPIAASASAQLADYAEVAVADHPAARVTDPAAMHLTFAFLGDVPEELVPVVAGIVDDAASRVRGPAALSVAGVDLYGDRRCLGVDVEPDLLVLLNAARDHVLATAAAWAPELDRRPWRPHVTVARTSRTDRFDADLLERLDQPPAATWVVPELRLYASLPALGERQHRLLHTATFSGVPAR